MDICTCTGCTQLCTYVHVHMYMDVQFICTYMYICTCMYNIMYVYMYVHYILWYICYNSSVVLLCQEMERLKEQIKD